MSKSLSASIQGKIEWQGDTVHTEAQMEGNSFLLLQLISECLADIQKQTEMSDRKMYDLIRKEVSASRQRNAMKAKVHNGEEV